jgi:hypothetical protein
MCGRDLESEGRSATAGGRNASTGGLGRVGGACRGSSSSSSSPLSSPPPPPPRSLLQRAKRQASEQGPGTGGRARGDEPRVSFALNPYPPARFPNSRPGFWNPLDSSGPGM